MFTALFMMSRAARQAAETRGGTWPNVREQFGEFRNFLRDPTLMRARWRLASLTVGLLSVNLLGLLIWGDRPP
ncbi:hypothetical protein [Roseovarius dicentrarchi]|uniref:hypothetical protein n=1 Tax=Roseovarius dicentrarchi TaxID=2250573 RepID=UPI0013966C46|nr:hypothetical protein [Roseovarius dicentrarchi]